MQPFRAFYHIRKIVVSVCLLSLLLVSFPKNSFAIYEGVRRVYAPDASKRCNLGEIQYDPFVKNKDIEWDLSNPVCMAFVTNVGINMLSTQLRAETTCTPTNNQGLLVKSPGEETAKRLNIKKPTLGLQTAQALAYLGVHCASRLQESLTYQAAATQCTGAFATTPTCAEPVAGILPNVARSGADVTRCCASYANYVGVVGAAFSVLAVIWEIADNAYQTDRICGHDWGEWKLDEKGDWIFGKGDRAQCISDLFLGEYNVSNQSESCAGIKVGDHVIGSRDEHYLRSVANRFYREFIYGGVEYKDKGSGACSNPSRFSSGSRKDVLGYDDDKQVYYMTGPGRAPSFACRRFLDTSPTSETEAAYQCCKKRSQNVMCIEGRPYDPINTGLAEYEYSICELGQRCEVAGVYYDTYESKKASNYICAKTFSVCPYNHLVGGGTEDQEFIENENGRVVTKNYCQYLNHCQKLPITPYVRESAIGGEFISQACKDMKGDSQNLYSYNIHMATTRMEGFTAPIAQCYKETVENVFLNRAGHSVCSDPDEYPNKAGLCLSGYKLKKGEYLPSKSFFVRIQEDIKDYVRMALILAVMMFGVGILLAAPSEGVSKKKIMPFILKIGLVVYFAIGTAWQDHFIEGTLQASTLLSDMVFDIEESTQEQKLDGCQFPRFDYADNNEATKYDNPAYSPENKYLKIWDTLDCKITRALGYGPDVSVPNLIFMILGGLLTGGLGVLFFLATFFLAFLLLSIALRALQIFLISVTAIILLIYISPLIIPLCLFEKTKNVFSGWWKQLLGFSLQPVILFAYLGILISIIDYTVVGDVRFEGDGKLAPKKIICDAEVKNNSMYCIFKIAEIESFTGLEPIGVGLPILASMNQEKMNYLIKAAITLFIFFQFLDQIMVFAKKLVGGSTVSTSWGVKGIAEKATDTLKAVQERGYKGLAKHGQTGVKYAARKAGGAVGGMARAIGNKGKQTQSPNGNKADQAGSDQQRTPQNNAQGGNKGDENSSDKTKPNSPSK